MSIKLSDSIRVGQQKPLEDKYFNELVPYTSTSQVNTLLPKAIRHIGLTVNINGEEYWYKDGIDDSNLILKVPNMDTFILKNQEQDDRLENIEGENASQNDLINDLFSELQSEKTRNDIQDSALNNLEGINYIWSPTNRTLTLFDRGGNQLSKVSLVSLDNEGTDLRYNASTLSLELYNADNELLDSIPVSSFIGSVGTQLQLNSNQLQLKDNQGNILSTVTFEVSNVSGLQAALDGKQDALTEDNLGQFMDLELSTKVTPTSGDTVLGRDSLTGKAVEIPTSSFGGSGSVDTSNLVPYTGATQNLNIGANYFQTSKGFKLEKDLDNYFIVFNGGNYNYLEFQSKDNIYDSIGGIFLFVNPEDGLNLSKFDGNHVESNSFKINDSETYSHKPFVSYEGFVKSGGTATQSLTADGGVFDLNTKADLVDGKIPASQLPAYVDDVLEFANLASFPATGESGKIYIAIDTNLTYRWGGSSYVVMSSSLALGETSSTAYRGDRGKIAYDHGQTTGNPHGTTKSDVGLGNVPNLDTTNAVNNSHTHSNKSILDLITEPFTTSLKSLYDGVVTSINNLLLTGQRLITSGEITKLSNTSGTNTGDETTSSIQTKRPLKTIEGQSLEGSGNIDLTKNDIGLGNVDNTSDLNKPISTATQAALNNKQDKLTNPITGTGTVNYLTKFTANGVIGDSIIYENNNNISIGDNVSDATLRVKAQGASFIDIAFRVRNSANTKDFLVVNGAGDVYNNGASGLFTNTFFGEEVGRNTTGYDNSAFGYKAFKENTIGRENSAFGNDALGSNIEGNYNSAFGNAALMYNTSGSRNTSCGSGALVSNTTGDDGSAFGYAALFNNTTGIKNNAFGDRALGENTTGSQNIAIGTDAGRYIPSGGVNNISDNSIYIGNDTRPNTRNETNQIVIGHSARGDGSNSVVLGNSSITRTRLQGQVIMGSFTTQPSGIEGAIYYNSTNKKHYGFNGTTWNALY